MRIVSESLGEKVNTFRELKDGWDTYNGKSISTSVIAKALSIASSLAYRATLQKRTLPMPHIFPLSNGGIEFEFNSISRDILFSIHDREKNSFEYLIIDKTSKKQPPHEDIVNSEGEIIDILFENI